MKKLICLLLAAAMLFCLAACKEKPSAPGTDEATTAAPTELTKINFALDWTQNTNHTGLYVAKEKGYFAEAGLDVDILFVDGDSSTQLVASGWAPFGIDAQDTLAAAYTAAEPLPVTAIAAILQHNTSGIISRKGDGIDSAKGLAGKTYSTWDIPIEKAMLQTLVEKDGGNWDEVTLIPNNITDEPGALSAHQTDAVWVFYGWSCVNAQVQGFDFDWFYFRDLDPTFDYYTPVIIGNDDYMKANPELTKAFMAAVKKGYEYAAEHPAEAAQILIDSDQDGVLADAHELVMRSQEYLSEEYIADAPYWGYIDPARWNAFYGWLNGTGLLEKELPEGIGFTNEYLG
ncbi:MAG: ABC transporter substrate-binding protein [Clostridia bacterium]|nr:ABC transporter substrate-binding protein [Clostridia bacterium]